MTGVQTCALPICNADAGAFDATNSTITVKVALSKLNPLVTHGPAIGPGSVLQGLRGQTFTTGANGARDATRGGGSYVMCNEVLAVEANPTPASFGLSRPVPNPSHDGASVQLSLPFAAWTEFSVFDQQGRRVRVVHAGPLPAGTKLMTWDGLTDGGRRAASGMYFLRMNAAGNVSTRQVIMLH